MKIALGLIQKNIGHCKELYKIHQCYAVDKVHKTQHKALIKQQNNKKTTYINKNLKSKKV